MKKIKSIRCIDEKNKINTVNLYDFSKNQHIQLITIL